MKSLVSTLPAAERYIYVYEDKGQVLDQRSWSHPRCRDAAHDVVHVSAEFPVRLIDYSPASAARFTF